MPDRAREGLLEQSTGSMIRESTVIRQRSPLLSSSARLPAVLTPVIVTRGCQAPVIVTRGCQASSPAATEYLTPHGRSRNAPDWRSCPPSFSRLRTAEARGQGLRRQPAFGDSLSG